MKPEKIYIELLLLKTQAGDGQAWDNLITIIQVKAKAFAHKFLSNLSAVDNCYQDALLVVIIKKYQSTQGCQSVPYLAL